LSWPHKYIRSSDGQHELYDLAADPEERTNLTQEQPVIAARLHRLLDKQLDVKPIGPSKNAPPLSEAELEAMRALGYAQ
jgi:hypothetical protein